MSAHLDGGPAYPAPATPKTDMYGYDVTSGMSLRDWFAGQALAAMSADLLRNQEYGATMRELAKKAYFIADCMLAAREAQP